MHFNKICVTHTKKVQNAKKSHKLDIKKGPRPVVNKTKIIIVVKNFVSPHVRLKQKIS